MQEGWKESNDNKGSDDGRTSRTVSGDVDSMRSIPGMEPLLCCPAAYLRTGNEKPPIPLDWLNAAQARMCTTAP